MNEIMIDVLVWQATEAQAKLVQKMCHVIGEIIDKELGEKVKFLYGIKDVSYFNFLNPPQIVTLVFGPMALTVIEDTTNDLVWQLDSIENLMPSEQNIENRKRIFSTLKEIAKTLIKSFNAELNKPQYHVDIDGITVGKEKTDIIVSTQELEFIKEIKELLPGSKMVITKGDIKIEASDA